MADGHDGMAVQHDEGWGATSVDSHGHPFLHGPPSSLRHRAPKRFRRIAQGIQRPAQADRTHRSKFHDKHCADPFGSLDQARGAPVRNYFAWKLKRELVSPTWPGHQARSLLLTS